MWLVNFRNLLIRACGLIILSSGCGALRVAIPKEAQAFRDKIISDSLSYSYSALEFGASNETHFKTWSVVKNLSQPGHVNKSQHEYGYEDNRFRGGGGSSVQKKKPKQHQQQQQHWPNHNSNNKQNSNSGLRPTKKSSPIEISSPGFRPSDFPRLESYSDIYPHYGFHPLLFSTPALPTRHPHVIHFDFRSSTAAPFRPSLFSTTGPLLDPLPPTRIVLTTGISVGDNNSNKKINYKQLGRLKKGKPRNGGFRKGKLRPMGLDHFNTGVQQALLVPPPPPSSSSVTVSFSGKTTPGGTFRTSTANPFPNLSPGYSRVTQNLPNSLPSVIYGTNHLDEDAFDRELLNGNNTWIPIVGPIIRAGVNSNKNSNNNNNGGSGAGQKGRVNLTRILKNKARPRHRYSSNYSSSRNSQAALKVRSHRLAGILSQSQKSTTGGGGGGLGADVIAVYPNNKNYSTVTARSRAQKTTPATTTTRQRPTANDVIDYGDEYEDDDRIITSSTTTEPTTTESEVIHARITKIPNRQRPADVVVLNVTTQFPVDEKVRARLKAIRKIVRRLP